MTTRLQAWILTSLIFMVLMMALPDSVIYFLYFAKWLWFAITLLFWFLVSLGLAALLMSCWVEYREKHNGR